MFKPALQGLLGHIITVLSSGELFRCFTAEPPPPPELKRCPQDPDLKMGVLKPLKENSFVAHCKSDLELYAACLERRRFGKAWQEGDDA